jgi:hypothetical protein
VIIHSGTEERVRLAVTHPLTMIASDGFDIQGSAGHPRSAGTYSRVLGRYDLPLMEALGKMTLMEPAGRSVAPEARQW